MGGVAVTLPVMDRAEIKRRAGAMIDVRWTTPSVVRIWTEQKWEHFYPGQYYVGMPYHWWGNDDLDTFVRKIAAAVGGELLAGNDCSSFLGHAWAIPERMTTSTLAADAVGPQRYCRALGAAGSCQSAGLKPGDACNLASWHVIMVGEVRSDGVISAEQTPGPRLDASEMRRFWSWGWLADHQYVPIRRQNLSGEGEPEVTLEWPATPGATWYRLWVSVDERRLIDTWLDGATRYDIPAPALHGRYRWWIRPWSSEAGSGRWQAGPDFRLPKLPGWSVTIRGEP